MADTNSKRGEEKGSLYVEALGQLLECVLYLFFGKGS